MRLSRLVSATFVVATASAAMIFACGGDGPSKSPDAKVFQDAKVFMDAPPGLMGLGQKCGSNLPACPATAPECIGLTQGGTTYCTPHCLDGGSGMTNGSARLTTTTPAPDGTKCTSQFSGSAGSAACGVILSTVPADNPLMANKLYTGIVLGCIVLCGTGGACPTGMTCAQNTFCLPN